MQIPPIIDLTECGEKARLFAEYNRAVSEWNDATELLEIVTKERLKRSIELREIAFEAKKAYNEHKSDHGC